MSIGVPSAQGGHFFVGVAIKKTLAAVVAATMIATAMPAAASAQEADTLNEVGQVLNACAESSFGDEGNVAPLTLSSADLGLGLLIVGIIAAMQGLFFQTNGFTAR